MQEYDYRISHDTVNEAEASIDKLSNKKLLKLVEVVEEFEQKQEEERLTKAKDYFNVAILPGLQDFAELSASILYVEEHDEKNTMQVIFKNEMGFDITESCRLMRSLLLMSNFIGIMAEGEYTVLSLIYDYKEMIDY